jgi:hypothetical protein
MHVHVHRARQRRAERLTPKRARRGLGKQSTHAPVNLTAGSDRGEEDTFAPALSWPSTGLGGRNRRPLLLAPIYTSPIAIELSALSHAPRRAALRCVAFVQNPNSTVDHLLP